MEKTQVAHLSLTPTYQFGLAWLIVRDLQGTRIVRHGGGTPGHSAFVASDRSRRRGVVVLSSTEDIVDIGAIGKLLLKSKWESDRRPTETKLSGPVYGSYVGRYRLYTIRSP